MASTKYRFKKKYATCTISVPAKSWTVTADTLTDEQAEYLMDLKHPGIEAMPKAKASKKD